MALGVMIKSAGPIALDLEFQVQPGELMALVGPSGSGKTTVLRTIAGLWQPTKARVTVGGVTWLDTDLGIALPPHRRKVGIVFQSYALFPHMTAKANVMAALDHFPTARRPAEARRLLALVGLDGLDTRLPAQLSGGQQQRVAVARALARSPAALLLDEPFSAVDRKMRETLYREIGDLRAVLNMPVILVTHDMNEAQLLADTMVVIEAGRMLRAGSTAEIMFDPAALRGMGLREASATLNAVIADHEDDGLTRLETAAGPLWLPHIKAGAGTRVRIRIMAHEVILSRDAPFGLSALNILPATVIEVMTGDGPGAIVRLQLGQDVILARVTRRSAAALALGPGVTCFAILKSMSVARDQVGVATIAKKDAQ